MQRFPSTLYSVSLNSNILQNCNTIYNQNIDNNSQNRRPFHHQDPSSCPLIAMPPSLPPAPGNC